MQIRSLRYEDLSDASHVLWKSFYRAEKDNHSMAGMERFRDLVSPVSLSINTFDGKITLYGAFEKDELLAVGGLKEKKHVLLLYVLPERQNEGIGKALLAYMEKESEGEEITLNSSDEGIMFYEKLGYRKTGERRVEEDLIFTPMKKKMP